MIKKLLLAALLFVALVGLPLTIYLFQTEQDTRSKASASTTLSLIPQPGTESSVQKNVGDTFSVDLMIDPGSNAVLTVTAQIKYDPTKLEPTGDVFVTNAAKFPTVLEGPTVNNGTVSQIITVGLDTTKAITAPTKAGTFTFKTLAKTSDGSPSIISFSAASKATSADATGQARENVLSTTNPASVTIIGPSTSPSPSTSPVPQKPDLTITSLALKPNPAGNSCGQLGLLVTFKNQGQANVSSPFNLKANNNTTTLSVSSLASGSSQTVWFSSYLAGSNTVTIDSGNTIVESDETNNQKTQTLSVPERPQECITPTISLNSTQFVATAYLHNIGNSGDNANPTMYSLSNKNPIHQPRTFSISVYDGDEQLVTSKQASLDYDDEAGNFTGTVTMDINLAGEDYIIKIKTDSFLQKRVPGFLHILPSTKVTLTPVTLVAGDVNGDNNINIVDYNILIGCFSDFLPPVSCDSAKKVLSDLNDDDSVNQTDLTLFLRELTFKPGI